MAKLETIDAIHLTIIKRYRFLEPVFKPDKLYKPTFPLIRERYDFLGDADKIRIRINRMKTFTIKDIGIMKPLRNPNISQETFWLPFKFIEKPVDLGIRTELPMYPFQVIPNRMAVKLNRGNLEDLLGFAVSDYKMASEVRIYPPGVATVQLHLYFKAKEKGVEIDGLVNLTSNLRKLRIITTFRNRTKNFGLFGFFKFLFDNVYARIVSGDFQPSEVSGYYIVCNLQGDPVNIQNHEVDLAKILAIKPRLETKKLARFVEKMAYGKMEGKDKDDILVVSPRVAVVYVDNGIRKKYKDKIRPGVLQGRRCFRNHFTTAIEMAYVTEPLLAIYKEQFNAILTEIEKINLQTSTEIILKKLITTGILDPCAYGTLVNKILNVADYLKKSRADGFWAQLYTVALTELKLDVELKELKEVTNAVFKAAEAFTEENRTQLQGIARTVGDIVTALVEAITRGAVQGIK